MVEYSTNWKGECKFPRKPQFPKKVLLMRINLAEGAILAPAHAHEPTHNAMTRHEKRFIKSQSIRWVLNRIAILHQAPLLKIARACLGMHLKAGKAGIFLQLCLDV